MGGSATLQQALRENIYNKFSTCAFRHSRYSKKKHRSSTPMKIRRSPHLGEAFKPACRQALGPFTADTSGPLRKLTLDFVSVFPHRLPHYHTTFNLSPTLIVVSLYVRRCFSYPPQGLGVATGARMANGTGLLPPSCRFAKLE